ncbi:hypothetical protein E1B28_004452 [Marasmius oreades]|uniref:F-box domain-containing protein n=1 Tax=Marasmius oreades TaxID=181124 RepID=A0A9P8AD04_9AGAR|nr:uncharacterized protein E1B28_004452 [Marasmius oreades]KAG7097064.1 hypothetical protein E1B28_004452 [Marasmius oreades]
MESIGDLPTDEEFARIKEAICEEESAIAGIDVQIDGLMREICRLRFKQTKHRERIGLYQGSISLARRLPQEILASIFQFCARDGWTRFPLTASHVCRQWRAASMIPLVWSHLYIEANNVDPYRRASFWLQRSDSAPLYITLDLRNETSTAEMLSPVVNLLLEDSRRWRSLRIISHWIDHANVILGRCNTSSFPQLRELDLAILDDFVTFQDGNQIFDGVELADLSDCFQNASQLRAVTISRNVLSSATPLPSSIADLTLHFPSSTISAVLSNAVLLNILEQLPLLHHLAISISSDPQRVFRDDVDEQRSIIIPSLHTLTITSNPDIFGFLPYIRTPSLVNLHLRSSTEPLGYVVESFGRTVLQFIESACPPIEHLELRDIDLSENHFLACFSHLPTLQTLRLHESDISDEVLNAFCGPEALCAHLKILDLRWCGQITGSTLVRLARSRLMGGSSDQHHLDPITTITLINCAFVGEQHIMDLSRIATCRIVMNDVDDCCRTTGCCNNERYRRRLYLRNIGAVESERKIIL